ncbi:hypothetical protein JHK86_000883 [Glycine max]|nr:hypothetical protein JHK86_000883 [Glycine max]
MALISAQLGFPYLFVTFTCNLNWPKIQRLIKPMSLTAQNRLDMVSRVFKLKLDNLLTNLKKNQIFRRVVAYIYTIELQKRGLPHAHIMLFLHSSNKYPSVKDINRMMLAEIPDQHEEATLYDCVKNHMLRGPCGFQLVTIVNQEEYAVYRRRDDSKFIEKNGVFLDNCHIVTYNLELLLRITASLETKENDQQTQSKCIDEVTLMQSYPPRALDRRFKEDWARDAGEGPRVLMSLRPIVKESMFTTWFKANEMFHEGSKLAKLLKVTKLIIWDEVLMAHKFCFEALDKALRDIMSFMNAKETPFGGKVVVFGGDFKQILPVIPRGSHIGDHKEVSSLKKFSEWLLCVVNGKLLEPNDGYAEIEILEGLLIKEFTDPIEAIVRVTYPGLLKQHNNADFLKSKAILASNIDSVDKINEYVLSLLPDDEK